jgi:CysZ protein
MNAPTNSSLVSTQPGPVALRLTPPGPLDGLKALFGGFGFILSTPSVWPLACVPILVALALTGLFGWAAYSTLPPLIDALLGAPSGRLYGVLASILKVLAVLVAFLVALLLGFGLAQPLSGPALERIVRRAEADLRAPAWPKTSFIDDVIRSLQSVAIGYAFGLPILALLVIVDLFFPLAIFVTFPIKVAVTAVLVTWDLCDYPLSIRGMPVGARVELLKRNIRAVLGFGVGLALVSLVPCAIVFVLPCGVAGAARLVVALEQWEARR